MKQHITVEQLSELTDEQKERLREWWEPQKGDWYYYPTINHSDVIATSLQKDLARMKTVHYPLLSIGRMIELLTNYFYNPVFALNEGDGCWDFWGRRIGGSEIIEKMADPKKNYQLCDILWEAVKAVLV